MNKVILMGNYPPPFGGVSTHIKRLYTLLKSDGFDVQILDISQTEFDENVDFLLRKLFVRFRSYQIRFLIFLLYSMFSRRKRILHIHIPLYSYWASCNLLYYISPYKFIFTVHDQVELEKVIQSKTLKGKIIRSFLKKRSIKYIAVSEAIVSQLMNVGVSKNQITCIPAFLPEMTNEAIKATEIVAFLSKGTSFIHYACSEIIWGEDVYGINFVLSALDRLKSIYPDFRLLMLMPFETTRDYQAEINKLGLSQHVLVYHKPINGLSTLFKVCSVYLRTTTTDGDAVAVREALYAGCKVIASDVSMRPEGCLIYKHNDLDSFSSCLRNVTNNDNVESLSHNTDFYTPIRRIYFNSLSR